MVRPNLTLSIFQLNMWVADNLAVVSLDIVVLCDKFNKSKYHISSYFTLEKCSQIFTSGNFVTSENCVYCNLYSHLLAQIPQGAHTFICPLHFTY